MIDLRSNLLASGTGAELEMIGKTVSWGEQACQSRGEGILLRGG